MALGLLSFAFPKDGIKLGESLKLEFIEPHSLLGTAPKKDVSKLIRLEEQVQR